MTVFLNTYSLEKIETNQGVKSSLHQEGTCAVRIISSGMAKNGTLLSPSNETKATEYARSEKGPEKKSMALVPEKRNNL